MDELSLEQKQQQFDEFFRIKHSLKANMKPLEDDFVLPHVDNLREHMPYAFRIATEVSTLEASALRPLRKLGEQAQELASFLNHQSRKIDLMMSYILHSQMEEQYQYESYSFGGGGVVLISDQPAEIGQRCELRLFIDEEASAVFCYGEIIACDKVEDDYHLSLIFTRIRDEDQEVLVRASLHLQTQQLRARKKQQDND
ncbi:hypothetical protein HMF8227_01205 [Saliniradius amylolyticus]|uniref:PilZ domain-containing protein n=1 Tax=Saliniradius amylolyticus TaxID=2183582 RepID=A0A2S2E212_9ALTE|nr:PilZ domain-containing protein [Saliniradius amylolyticus]AWL11686.1 hypothetical protein HMF8227_01205 [Saliniradius amylolyticus]